MINMNHLFYIGTILYVIGAVALVVFVFTNNNSLLSDNPCVICEQLHNATCLKFSEVSYTW